MDKTLLKTGKKYNVDHSRKGKFKIVVIKDDGEWVTGRILNGTANAILDYNVKNKGEEITVRKSFCFFK